MKLPTPACKLSDLKNDSPEAYHVADHILFELFARSGIFNATLGLDKNQTMSAAYELLEKGFIQILMEDDKFFLGIFDFETGDYSKAGE
uniref:Uncharacterized protein n=1 Tax=viral metagenome TaxID=1070528 RepID=A0A6M3LCB7_9ZZZZ